MKELVCVLFLLFGSLQLRALDREAFTFTKYDLNVRVEPEQQRLGVRGKITLRNDSGAPQRSLSLQISSSLNWSSIRFQGRPVEFLTQPYVSDIDHTGALSEAIVVLPQAVAPKQSVELEIGYEGVVPQDTTRLTRIGVPAEEAKHADWDQISPSFAAVRGVGYVVWYPVAINAVSLTDGDAVPDAVVRWKKHETQAELDANLCVVGQHLGPKILTNATPGGVPAMSAGGIAGDEGFDCIAQSFTGLGVVTPTFTLGTYSTLPNSVETIYFLPDHESAANDFASAIDEVVPLITRWFGDHRENPQRKAQVVELPDTEASSFESGSMLLTPLKVSDTKLLLSSAQQLSRLFFPSPRTWIHDGLANYAQARLIEQKEGRQAAIGYLQAHRSGMLESEKETSSNQKESDRSLTAASDLFRVEAKAMYVWWMLRDLVGENAFNASLHSYKVSDDNDPAYMQKLLETQSHKQLQWFFDDWVYHDRGLPDFRIPSVYPSPLPSGGYMVTVTVENLGGAGAEVPVTLHTGTDELTERLLVPAKSKASVRIQTPSLPDKATVNDGSVPESNTSNNEYEIQSLSH